ncbi:MAG: HEPN domain-containing protein [Defluviitaleaceae bacterium]|nr:HEPN domain-containing protein [Defluviitaleaceae bacterium]
MEATKNGLFRKRTYWDIALNALDDAMFGLENERYCLAALHFHRFAEKGAKALLAKTDPQHSLLQSPAIGLILLAYDPEGYSKNGVMDGAGYLTTLYFGTQSPGIGYIELTKEHAETARRFALQLRQYFEAEIAKDGDGNE